MTKYFYWLIAIFLTVFVVHLPIFAQNQANKNIYKQETIEGKIVRTIEEKPILLQETKKFQFYQRLEILITKGSLKGKKIVVENGNLPVVNYQRYQIGDQVVINYSKDFSGKESFYITDFIRRQALLVLFFIFILITVLIAGWQGVASLLGMGVSFLVIFKFILPKIYIGWDPVQTAILGSLIIVPFTFLLSHGINKKTLIAMLGTIIALIITGIFANIFVEAARLTGFAAEEANFLQVYLGDQINIKGLLLAGIIIGVLGILDDITISQSAIVNELKKTNPKLSRLDVYKKAMAVGKDHIASTVNTLVLVYTGAALPLMLLFVAAPRSFLEIVNYEMIAEEVIRTLVASIGLITAVPITTFFASVFINEKN
jgi:uncharacterized membrane protein